ncbi:uncharacterized protein LOC122004446 [Zingiber officinale]|uniref:uncharacterized protein LOC122004446 n=1 Tax=Zingiber officinale TaxID=94328 RepID=UPI001C4C25C7|nr:uncharacterized protein LOC122004446 [Zingiber officinale]
MDIMGPFPMATGQRRFLLIAVDYFSKRGELELLAKISEQMAEVMNWEILKGLRTQLDHTEGSWIDELSSVLWALRMTPKEATDVTPFYLVYGGETVVLVEVGVESDRIQLYDGENVERRLIKLDLMDEVRAKATV